MFCCETLVFWIKELKSRIQNFKLEEFLEQIEKRQDQIDEQLLDMLFSLSDFQIFKEVMLEEKKKMLRQLENTKNPKKIKHKTNNNNIFSLSNKNEFLNSEEHKKENKNPIKIPEKQGKKEMNLIKEKKDLEVIKKKIFAI